MPRLSQTLQINTTITTKFNDVVELVL